MTTSPIETRLSGAALSDLIAAFSGEAEQAASVVHQCDGIAEAVALVLTLSGGRPISASPALVARYPELARRLEDLLDLTQPLTAADASRVALGVGVGDAFVAETGSILVAESGLADRLVSMLSPVLVLVVPASAALGTLEEVGAVLTERHAGGAAGYHGLITGPSRSADIERSLTIGVQGPSDLHVAILYTEHDRPGAG